MDAVCIPTNRRKGFRLFRPHHPCNRQMTSAGCCSRAHRQDTQPLCFFWLNSVHTCSAPPIKQLMILMHRIQLSCLLFLMIGDSQPVSFLVSNLLLNNGHALKWLSVEGPDPPTISSPPPKWELGKGLLRPPFLRIANEKLPEFLSLGKWNWSGKVHMSWLSHTNEPLVRGAVYQSFCCLGRVT